MIKQSPTGNSFNSYSRAVFFDCHLKIYFQISCHLYQTQSITEVSQIPSVWVCPAIDTQTSLGTSYFYGLFVKAHFFYSNFWFCANGIWMAAWGELGQWGTAAKKRWCDNLSPDLSERKHSSLNIFLMYLISLRKFALPFPSLRFDCKLCKLFVSWQKKKSIAYVYTPLVLINLRSKWNIAM